MEALNAHPFRSNVDTKVKFLILNDFEPRYSHDSSCIICSCISKIRDANVQNVDLISSLSFKVAYWISSNSSFIQYCDSNIGLFSFAPPLDIALNPFASIFV